MLYKHEDLSSNPSHPLKKSKSQTLSQMLPQCWGARDQTQEDAWDWLPASLTRFSDRSCLKDVRPESGYIRPSSLPSDTNVYTTNTQKK